MSVVRRFYQFLGKYKRRLTVFLLVATISVVLETIRPYWLKGILDNALIGKQSEVMRFLVLFGISTIGANLVAALSFYMGDRVVSSLSRDIKETVYEKVMELDFAYHVDKNTGSLISAFRRGDSAVFSIFQSLFRELFRVLIALAVTCVFLFEVSVPIAWALLILFFLNLGLIWILIRSNLKYRRAFNDSEDEISGIIADTMINYETVKFFAAERRENQHLSNRLKNWLSKFWDFSNSFRVMEISVGTTSGLGMLVILYMAVNQLGKMFTLGDLVMVAGFITGFYYQFFNMFFQIRDVAKNVSDMERYFGILDNEVKVKDPRRPAKLRVARGKIEFKNIGFVYPKTQEKILDDINLTIYPGQKVAFVGRSGAGKTTLVKLLLRFYDPSRGVIKIDGVDIKKMKKSTLRGKLSVVPQEPIMFNNTIKYNLAYGKENATMEEIELAAERANILEFIVKLPEGWETQVGERGIKLSGGQKQRLAIARCLLADPKILVFDEATSNLDSESERKIQGALEEASKQRTVIIIAHRFSTIRGADNIVVLSNGTIAETGKHEQLLEKKGLYQMLWTLQAKGKLDKEPLLPAKEYD